MIHTEHNAIRLIGIALPHTTTNKNGQSAIDCGLLWQQFGNENCAAAITGRIGNTIIAVYYGYEGDHTLPYHYFIGCPVEISADVPEGMNDLYIPKDVYQKLSAKGVMPDCVADAWRTIWAGNIPRAYHFDFEVYDQRSQDWQNAEVDIYVSTTMLT
jgi:predicted transcriptional regulator YdeE